MKNGTLLLILVLLYTSRGVLGKAQYHPQSPGQQYPNTNVAPYPFHPGVQSPAVPMSPFEGMSCLHTRDCDGTNTVLSCERGKCTCPARPQMQWSRGPYPLNTAWDSSLRKCLSLKDAACDVFNPKVVYCASGLACKAASSKDGFGICGSANKINTHFAFAILLGFAASILGIGTYDA